MNHFVQLTGVYLISIMAYKTTASLHKLTCTDNEDFSKGQDKFGQFLWSQNDSNYLDVKLKVFTKDDNKEFRLIQGFSMEKQLSTSFCDLGIKCDYAAEKFAREENLNPVLIPTMSKDLDEQFKLSHKVVDIVDQAIRKI